MFKLEAIKIVVLYFGEGVNFMKRDIEKYILEADDLEMIGENRLLVVTKTQNILLSEISQEEIDQCYEIFSEKFNGKKRRESKYLKVIWSDSEIKYLKESYLKKELEEISTEINKSKYQINLMLGKLKLIVKRDWTQSELDFLKENIERSTIWLAGELNRSVASIKSKKRVMKLEGCIDKGALAQ